MPSRPTNSAMAVVRHLRRAMNRHDAEAMAICCREDYVSRGMLEPRWRFQGNGTVRRNWARIFEEVRGIRADLVGSLSRGNTVWTEWYWHGTSKRDRRPWQVRGVILFGVKRDRIAWARLYLELPADRNEPRAGGIAIRFHRPRV